MAIFNGYVNLPEGTHEKYGISPSELLMDLTIKTMGI
jgi:hypothetical protein